jgi:hypothetical protein
MSADSKLLEGLHNKIYNYAADFYRQHSKDDNLFPPLLFVIKGFQPQDYAIPIGEYFGTAEGKNQIAKIISLALRNAEVSVIAMVTEAWYIQRDKGYEPDDDFPPPSECEDRASCISVIYTIAPEGTQYCARHKLVVDDTGARHLEKSEFSTAVRVESGRFKINTSPAATKH